MWQVGLAVAGAWCIAAGQAAQERPVAAVPGRALAGPSALLRLARDRRWLAGGALTLAGVAAHLVALSAAPVTLVQPLGVSGLLVAVWLSARWRRRRLSMAEVAGCVAVAVGLAGIVSSLPAQVGAAEADPTALALLCSAAALLCVAGPLLTWRAGGRVRALVLSASGGACFGVASALFRVVGSHLR
ncbi:MAG TPA: DMT family transporter, partial [Stackebrandtia sp.]|uniref:DMT family transporter n=1 Tax=Stackebrandtia sp. TaxID=2023065 RepID=UPI002D699C22